MGNASAKDIHDAVDACDLEKLEKILEAKIELIDALSKEVPINTFQPTPTTYSSYCLLLCSSPLLRIHSSPLYPSSIIWLHQGETPIFRACANGNMEVVELLLEFEADLSITCSSCMDMRYALCTIIQSLYYFINPAYGNSLMKCKINRFISFM